MRISTDSTSAGLRSIIRFGEVVPAVENVVVIVELSTGIPSTTNSGCEFPSIDFWPRIWMKLDEPGSPEDDDTTTPGAFAASDWTMFDSFDLRMSSDFTELTVTPRRSVVDCVPAPVMITSPRRSGLTSSRKSCVTFPRSTTFAPPLRRPIARTLSRADCPVARAAGTSRV